MTLVHLRAWGRERFPMVNGVAFVLMYLLALVVGRSAIPGAIVITVRDVPGLAALWSFFLWLRVLDEHKDFENDRIAHPNRVLQRGLVTLANLRLVAAAALAVQLGVSVWIDGGIGRAMLWWSVAVVWSVLMAKEFFVGAWLRRHIMWYALSHMIVMLPVAVWIATMGAVDAGRSGATWWLAATIYASTLALEIGRKMRSPEDEHPAADSYTQSLGATRAALVFCAAVAAATALSLATIAVVDPVMRAWVFVVAAAATGLALTVVRAFARSPVRRAAKRVMVGVGASMLAMQVMVLAAVLAARSVSWR